MKFLEYSIASAIIFLIVTQIALMIVLIERLDNMDQLQAFIESGTLFFVDFDNLLHRAPFHIIKEV